MTVIRIGDGRTIIKGWAGGSRKTGKSRVQLWRDVRDGRFPAPIELGRNSIGWFEDEIEAWLVSRPRRHYDAPSTKAVVTHEKVARQDIARLPQKARPRTDEQGREADRESPLSRATGEIIAPLKRARGRG